MQLYTRWPRASVTRPVLELKNFARVPLAPGQSRTVRFDVPVGQLGFYGSELAYVVECGTVQVLVGTSSRDLVEAGSVTIVPDPSGAPVTKAFDGRVTVI